MRALFRPAIILGSGSIITVVIGVVAAKIWAILIGPPGLGTVGLLQALIGLTVLIAGAGVTTALVRELAFATAHGDPESAAAMRIAANRIVWIGGTASLVIFIVGREPLAAFVLGDRSATMMIVLTGFAVVATLLASVQAATMNGYRRVAVLSASSAIGSAAAASVSIVVVWTLGPAAIALGIAVGAIAAYAIVLIARRRAVPVEPTIGERKRIGFAAKRLLSVGAPYALSLVIGTAVQLVLPIMILHRSGSDDVGFYRAATVISVGYLGFLLAAMAQDYYPRLSAVADDAPALAVLARQQLRFLLAVALPIIMVAIVLVPALLPILYSNAFLPASRLLELQLIGDLLKLPSWAVAFILLAQQRRVAYLMTESLAGIGLVSFSWLGMEAIGLPGVGLAYIGMYALYYPLIWFVVRAKAPIRADWTQIGIVATFAVSVAIAALPVLGLSQWRTPLAVAAAAASAALGLWILSMEFPRPWRLWRREEA